MCGEPPLLWNILWKSPGHTAVSGIFLACSFWHNESRDLLKILIPCLGANTAPAAAAAAVAAAAAAATVGSMVGGLGGGNPLFGCFKILLLPPAAG